MLSVIMESVVVPLVKTSKAGYLVYYYHNFECMMETLQLNTMILKLFNEPFKDSFTCLTRKVQFFNPMHFQI
jgi:hypothetical protein